MPDGRHSRYYNKYNVGASQSPLNDLVIHQWNATMRGGHLFVALGLWRADQTQRWKSLSPECRLCRAAAVLCGTAYLSGSRWRGGRETNPRFGKVPTPNSYNILCLGKEKGSKASTLIHLDQL